MKRNKLVVIETILIVIIAIEIILLVFSLYIIFNNMGRYVLKINDNNRLEIENLLKTSKYYDNTKNIKDLEKIEFFLDFNDYQFTLYYSNEEKELYDDNLFNLMEYIKTRGNSKVTTYIVIDILIVFSIIIINLKRKEISEKIDKENEVKSKK